MEKERDNKASPENVSLGVNFLLLYGPTAPMQSFKRHKPREGLHNIGEIHSLDPDLENTFSSLICSGLKAQKEMAFVLSHL